MAITFVGGTGAGRAGSTSTASQSITGLTGGSDSAPIEGDLVLVVVATATQARNPTCAISGWSTIGTQLNVTSTTYDTSLQVSYKFMGSTPDTSITIPSTGNIADGQSRRVLVFRGVDPTTPLDVAAVSATGTGTTRFNAAAITPTTAGAFIVVFGGGAASASTTALGTPSGLSGWGAYNGADTNDGSAGGGYYGSWTSGAYDPAAPTTGGSVNAANSWAAWTIALRPAPTPIPIDIDTAGSLTIDGQDVSAFLTNLGGNAWAPTAWASGAWATGAWDVAPSGSDLSLDIDTAGALTVAGQSLTIATSIATANGSLTLAGQSVLSSVNVALSNGSLTVSGQALTTALSVDVDAGALTLAGQALATELNVALSAGALTLAGQTVETALGNDLSVTIDAGALTLAGQTIDTDLTVTLAVEIDAGSLTLAGQTVAIDVGNDISVDIDAGELTLSGQSLTSATNVSLASGALTLTGQAIAYGLNVSVAAGNLTLSGQDLTAQVSGSIDVEIDAGNLTLSGESVSFSGIQVPRDPMLGGGPTRDDRKKFKKWLEKKPYQPIDVEIEAGTLSISGQQVGVSLTDYRKPFTISQDITRPLLRLPQKRKSVAVSVDIDKLIAEELRYAEELAAQKRKRRRKQDDEILLLM